MGIKPATTKPRQRPVRRRAPASTAARTGLADALFSSTQQRVLGLLFGQPERSFFATGRAQGQV